MRFRHRKIYNKLSTIIALYEDSWWKRGADVLESYWVTKCNKLMELLGETTVNQAGFSLMNENANEVATLVMTLFMSAVPPRPALGYSGPDENTKNLLGDKLNSINQFDWLSSHSGMRLPSKALMENIYRRTIWENSKNFHFGKYKK